MSDIIYTPCKTCGIKCKPEQLSPTGYCYTYCDTTDEYPVSHDRIYGLIHATWHTWGTMNRVWNQRCHIMAQWTNHYTAKRDSCGYSCRTIRVLPDEWHKFTDLTLSNTTFCIEIGDDIRIYQGDTDCTYMFPEIAEYTQSINDHHNGFLSGHHLNITVVLYRYGDSIYRYFGRTLDELTEEVLAEYNIKYYGSD